jgi:hypothetical protein
LIPSWHVYWEEKDEIDMSSMTGCSYPRTHAKEKKSFRDLGNKVLLTLAFVATGAAVARAQLTPAQLRVMASSRTNSLTTVKTPDAPNFGQFVQDRKALLALGKALFWDQQLGSDGQSCATCHYHAGADNRSKNQLDPGSLKPLIPTALRARREGVLSAC